MNTFLLQKSTENRGGFCLVFFCLFSLVVGCCYDHYINSLLNLLAHLATVNENLIAGICNMLVPSPQAGDNSSLTSIFNFSSTVCTRVQSEHQALYKS